MSGGPNSILGSSFGQPGAPGFVPPAATAALGPAMGQSLGAMANRYNQLGMSGSTPEAMDLGLAPSVAGGIPGQFAAGGGELQNQAVGGAPIGKNASPASILGNVGSFLGH